MDLTGAGTVLTAARIFATMELIGTLRYVLFFLGLTFSFYFELEIIIERFCTIFNIEDKRIVRIDPITKEIVRKQ